MSRDERWALRRLIQPGGSRDATTTRGGRSADGRLLRRARQWWGCRLYVERKLARDLARKHGARRVVDSLKVPLHEGGLTRLDAELVAEGLRELTGREPRLPRGLRHGYPRYHHVPAVALAFARTLKVPAAPGSGVATTYTEA